jgi:hypothetical protein
VARLFFLSRRSVTTNRPDRLGAGFFHQSCLGGCIRARPGPSSARLWIVRCGACASARCVLSRRLVALSLKVDEERSAARPTRTSSGQRRRRDR